MKEFFRELFAYNHHCNLQLIKALVQNPESVSEKCLKLMSHILNAGHIWNVRLVSAKQVYRVWDQHDAARFEAIENENHTKALELIDQLDPDHVIAYTTSQGEPFSNNARDILFHVINHSNYHRAQIAAELKSRGIVPPISDYIFYKR